MCFDEIFSHASAKKKEKRLKCFKFGMLLVLVLSDITAVKGLIYARWTAPIIVLHLLPFPWKGWPVSHQSGKQGSEKSVEICCH